AATSAASATPSAPATTSRRRGAAIVGGPFLESATGSFLMSVEAFLRTIDEFDFTYQSTLRLTTIGSLLTPDFVTEGHSVILEGKPVRGKTHLAIAIAYRAIQNGFDA